ncbi:hypothetical protein J4Q44_G00089730 [Coregonus suidteri]|uniref:Uncharacterized protein n=1 Tax=Coregonus suidteri TaxID=861788 RepID=A0AAN8R0R9_9TELE
MDKAAKAVSNSEIVSAPGRITMLEMKDQNARQRAASGTPSDEHLRNSLRQVEERNVELETKFTELGSGVLNVEGSTWEVLPRPRPCSRTTPLITKSQRREKLLRHPLHLRFRLIRRTPIFPGGADLP